jgi:hypothetical protein
MLARRRHAAEPRSPGGLRDQVRVDRFLLTLIKDQGAGDPRVSELAGAPGRDPRIRPSRYRLATDRPSVTGPMAQYSQIR